MSRYAWVLNLDAELELSRGRPGYVAQRKLTAQLAEHGRASLALLGPGDVLLDQETPSHRDGSQGELRGRAWCPTPLALQRLRAWGVEPEPHPRAEVLRQVNHRLFAHQVGGGLPGQAYVTTRAELLTVVGDFSRRWLLKRPLTFAGRGQMRIIGPLTEKQWSWVEVSFERDGLIVEPLVVPTFEVSLHGFVWRTGQFELGRVCAQSVSERGTFRGVRLTTDSDLAEHERQALYERVAAVARALHGRGYFGPFGVDAYRYLLEEQTAFCSLSEVNARYTLGFVTGFPRHPSELTL